MEVADAIEKIDRILVEDFEIDRAILKPEAKLADDLGIDSLDAVDLIVAIERFFDCRIEETEAQSMLTLGDVYAAIERRADQITSSEGT